jgi:hypothetical protein
MVSWRSTPSDVASSVVCMMHVVSLCVGIPANTPLLVMQNFARSCPRRRREQRGLALAWVITSRRPG